MRFALPTPTTSNPILCLPSDWISHSSKSLTNRRTANRRPPQELYNMKKYSPQLVVLDLRDNPICTDKAYRSTALRKLKYMER